MSAAVPRAVFDCVVLLQAASYVVTWDKDLLDLMDETQAEGNEFRERFPGLQILTPVAFLNAIDAQPTTDAALS